MTRSSPSYIGRFAPSPTGKLHSGSLLAALASYLDAKANNGLWLVRMEDLDPPREEPGAAQAILDCLKAHHLVWDFEVTWQSQRHHLYQAALEQLIANNKAYPCSCSRQDLAASNGLHLGRCDNKQGEIAWRFACKKNQFIEFNDRLLGAQRINLAEQVGDFVIKRKDGLFAYQLAVVVDDFLQGITDIVRGNDLLDSTFRQIALQQNLYASNLTGSAANHSKTESSTNSAPSILKNTSCNTGTSLTTPNYCHLPVLIDKHGSKLSKQSFAPEINQAEATHNLLTALAQLNQTLPPASEQKFCESILEWAIEHWQLEKISTEKNIPV